MGELAIAVSRRQRDGQFSYIELANGFAAICDLVEAHASLRERVVFSAQFDKAAVNAIEMICASNYSLQSDTPIQDDGESALELGLLSASLSSNTAELTSCLQSSIPHYDGTHLNASVLINLDEPSCVLIEQQTPDSLAATLLRRSFYSILVRNPGARFTFVDLASGGNAFPFAHELVTTFAMRSGGKVHTNDSDFDRILKELSSEAGRAIALLGDTYASAAEYNKTARTKISRHFVAIALGDDKWRNESAIKELTKLVQNRKKSNVDIFLIGNPLVIDPLAPYSDLCIMEAASRFFAGRDNRVSFSIQLRSPADAIETTDLVDALKNYGKIDSRYEANSEVFPDLLTLESSDALRIPFALAEDGSLQYFEIGGNAAAHALISGKTGSGKSVALHTLIMQTVCNYHPDDVEIWAIDYKAVEFDWYIQHKAPHFKVIARDNTDEFTFSLLDLIYEEYERRQALFLEEGVSSIGQYRKKVGPRSLPRIVVLIDEFQIMTQAVQAYSGGNDYRRMLENLLKLTRAMGISFVFCSQTVASGLGGLTDAARDQIACRLCLQQQSVEEIRETLAINGPDESGLIQRVENLKKGQAIYKRSRWQDEYAPDGKAYEIKPVSVIYMSEDQRTKLIERVNGQLDGDFTPKEEVVVRGESRVSLMSKDRHPVAKYLQGKAAPRGGYVEWYPAAPASLADSFCAKLEDSAGSNVLVVGENDELRESIITHTVVGLLSDPHNRVIATFINENYPDRRRMIGQLRLIASSRFQLNVGVASAQSVISSLRRIKPDYENRTIYLWYGLDRLENELFLVSQKEEAVQGDDSSAQGQALSPQEAIDDLAAFLASFSDSSRTTGKPYVTQAEADGLEYSDCKAILRQAFERGPENNCYHFVIFNNRKSLKKSGMVDLSDFDNRIGTRMNSEDAFDLFGSSQAMKAANESTVILFAGSSRGIPLRPYLMPTDDDYAFFNEKLRTIDQASSM